jgi:hypothetical protein
MSSTIGRRRVKRIGEDSSALTSGGGGGGLAQGDRLVLPSGQPAVRCRTGDGRVFAKKKDGRWKRRAAAAAGGKREAETTMQAGHRCNRARREPPPSD